MPWLATIVFTALGCSLATPWTQHTRSTRHGETILAPGERINLDRSAVTRAVHQCTRYGDRTSQELFRPSEGNFFGMWCSRPVLSVVKDRL
jgi:hypothetical protein